MRNDRLPDLKAQCWCKRQCQIDLGGIKNDGRGHAFQRRDGDVGHRELTRVAAAIRQKIGMARGLELQQGRGKIEAIKGDAPAGRIIQQRHLQPIEADRRCLGTGADLTRADIEVHLQIAHDPAIGQLPPHHARDRRAHQIDPCQRRADRGDIARGQAVEGKGQLCRTVLRAA